MVNGPMALKVAGYPADHPGIARGIRAVDDFLMEIPSGHLIAQPCVSPVWDTALAAKALLDSGMAEDHPVLVKAAGWLVDQQIFEPGDWSIKNPTLQPGGWAFEFANDWYPDVDDSAVILMVLRRIRHPDGRRMEEAIRRGLNWTIGMQSHDGGWAAFDTDNTLDLLNRIPFRGHEGDDRPAHGGRHRSPARAHGLVPLRRQRSTRRARARVPAPDAGALGGLVGTVGRELHLRHVVRAGRAARARRESGRRARAARRGLGEVRAERRRRIRRGLPILR